MGDRLLRDQGGQGAGRGFLDACPAKVEARFAVVLEAVRDAPPPQFSGGGYWEAMHGDMGGYYEIRLTGPGRRQYRLFCILKDSGKKFSDRDYAKVRVLGGEYLAELPRRIAT